MQNLPIGIQSFDMLRAKDLVYVDKTKQIYDLVSGDKGFYFFLSRPRRFGKSLLVATLKELFLGNKELFKGLWIHESNYVWAKHPVIHLDFSAIAGRTPEEFRIDFAWKLDRIGKSYGIDISSAPSVEAKIEGLIDELAKTASVAILIDEYDKPLLNHVNNMPVMREMQAILSSFYGTLKAHGENIRFLFMTGVTKFSKTSVFSGMNNLIDLTFLSQAADLLGYTETEIDQYFQLHMQAISKEQHLSLVVIKDEMRYWYNGYQFSKIAEKVYNPFSVLMYLFTKDLRNYWFETGTPTFLVNLIRERKYNVEDLEDAEINVDDFGSYDLDRMKLVPLLLQTGYLTIKSYDAKTGNYQLGYPNEETKSSFLLYFMDSITEVNAATAKNKTLDLANALIGGDLQRFFDVLKVFFASIPYDIQLSKEQYYQSIFYVLLSLLGAYVAAEVRTNNGRIDCTVITDAYIYIFEFKLNGTDAEALQQIEEKRYYEKFLHDNKAIILVGAAFETDARNISNWSFRELEQ